MILLFTALKIYYVLDPALPPLPAPTPDEADAVTTERKKCEEDELVCRGHILTDCLYGMYSNLKSPTEIWTVLETKYKNEKKGKDKFLALKYFEYKIFDNLPVMDQVYELQVLVSKLSELEISIPDSFQITAILSKLPTAWSEYRKKILHSS